MLLAGPISHTSTHTWISSKFSTSYWICLPFIFLILVGVELPLSIQSQKAQRFRVAKFGMLSDEQRPRSKIVLLFNTEKEPCVRKFEGLTRSKNLGISQTV